MKLTVTEVTAVQNILVALFKFQIATLCFLQHNVLLLLERFCNWTNSYQLQWSHSCFSSVPPNWPHLNVSSDTYHQTSQWNGFIFWKLLISVNNPQGKTTTLRKELDLQQSPKIHLSCSACPVNSDSHNYSFQAVYSNDWRSYSLLKAKVLFINNS